MTSVLDDLVQSRVAADPVTTALAGSVRDAVAEALAAHLPRLAFTTAETAQMLGATGEAVCKLVQQGRLVRVAGPQSPISIGSILALVGWPVTQRPGRGRGPRGRPVRPPMDRPRALEVAGLRRGAPRAKAHVDRPVHQGPRGRPADRGRAGRQARPVTRRSPRPGEGAGAREVRLEG